jgi:ribose/xylose/arabinose/galactoside ABC-type transport system permease subunit
MMLIARGMSRYLCKGVPIWDLPEEFEFLGNGYLFEGSIGPVLPVPVAVMIVVYGVGHFTLSSTRFGRHIYAVGGNEEATRLSGIPINRVKLAAYVITGGLSAVAGIIMAARLQCGHPETGALYELYVIAACVVGGASLMGGQGKILCSLIGALLIWVIFNGLNLLYVDSYLQQAFLGLVIFVAVLLDQAKKRLSY